MTTISPPIRNNITPQLCFPQAVVKVKDSNGYYIMSRVSQLFIDTDLLQMTSPSGEISNTRFHRYELKNVTNFFKNVEILAKLLVINDQQLSTGIDAKSIDGIFIKLYKYLLLSVSENSPLFKDYDVNKKSYIYIIGQGGNAEDYSISALENFKLIQALEFDNLNTSYFVRSVFVNGFDTVRQTRFSVNLDPLPYLIKFNSPAVIPCPRPPPCPTSPPTTTSPPCTTSAPCATCTTSPPCATSPPNAPYSTTSAPCTLQASNNIIYSKSFLLIIFIFLVFLLYKKYFKNK
jgi:hypothetical protein